MNNVVNFYAVNNPAVIIPKSSMHWLLKYALELSVENDCVEVAMGKAWQDQWVITKRTQFEDCEQLLRALYELPLDLRHALNEADINPFRLLQSLEKVNLKIVSA